MDDSEEFSEVPDLSKWFSSYVYESPMLDTSDGLEFLGESKGTKEMELVSSQAKDMSQSQVEFSEDIMNLVVEDSEIDEDCSIWGKPQRKGSSIFRKPKRMEETTTTYEAELTSLRNRVQYLENECFGFTLNIELLKTEGQCTGDVITDDPGNKLETWIKYFLEFAKSLLDSNI